MDMQLYDTSHLRWTTKYSYGVGHVFNDLCASMWFTYLLVFFEKVLEFSPSTAGVVLLVGQLADGISTPIVGIFSDKENKIPACAVYGRRKVWHLIGTLFVLISFPFIFSACLGCQDADPTFQLIYYCVFVIIFQYGWASVQISHLSLIPELTHKKHSRTELNSIRYAFTVLSNLSVYAVAFLVLGSGDSCSLTTSEPSANYTISTMAVTGDASSCSSSITPADANEFRNMAFFCIIAGSLFSAIFHIGVKEPPYTSATLRQKSQNAKEAMENGLDAQLPHVRNMRKRDWFKEIAFYQVAVLYMATRLYVNLYQVYIPLYVQDTLKLNKTAVATVPFTMYLAGFAGSLVMKQINKKIGRKGTFSLGCLFGLSGCVWVALGSSDAYETWGIYVVACLLGIGGSTVLITSLSITSDLIGANVEGGAFVYGFMSLIDKFSNGIIIMIIQNAYNDSADFYRNVITYACGAACVLGILVAISLIPVKIGRLRGLSNTIAKMLEEETDDSGSEASVSEKHNVLCTIYDEDILDYSNNHVADGDKLPNQRSDNQKL